MEWSMNKVKRGLRSFTDEQLQLFIAGVQQSIDVGEKLSVKSRDFLATCTDPDQLEFVAAGMRDTENTLPRAKRLLSVATAEQQRRRI
jgi:hypothetical protein